MWSHPLALTDSMGRWPYFLALQRGLSPALPLILIGAVAQLIQYPPWPWLQWQLVDLFGPKLFQLCGQLTAATFGIASLVVLVGFSVALTQLHNERAAYRNVSPAAAAAVVLACFFVMVLPAGNERLLDAFAMDKGLFVAVVVASLGGKLFLWLSGWRRLRVSQEALGSDPLVGEMLVTLPAAMLCILFFALAKVLLAHAMPASTDALVGEWTSALLARSEDSPVLALAYTTVSQLLWFFGLHGPNVLHVMQDRVFEPAATANIVAYVMGAEPPFVFTSSFFHFFTRIGGSGSTLCLIVALLLASNSTRSRKFAVLALLPAIFNINEPLLLALPLVFNPVYVLPFVLVPAVQAMTAYGAILAGWMPKTGYEVIWTTPALYSGYAVTQSLSGTLVQLLCLLVGVAMYLPFVRIADELAHRRGREVLRSLQRIAENPESALKARRLLHLDGEEGRMARALASELEGAFEDTSQVFLHYQPQIDISTGRACGVEALLRWRHPHCGPIAPPVTVTLAEDIGCVDRLGLRILRLACRQRAAWRGKVPADFVMSVNVSPGQLADPGFDRKVLEVLAETGLPPQALELEITESTVLAADVRAPESLRRLRQQGVKIALDDFGMGHTSLHYLRQLPLDAVKLDRSLADVAPDSVNEHIVRSIVDLSRALGLSMVVEGVEDKRQLDRLAALGCTRFQGYYFSRPLEPRECLREVRARLEAQPALEARPA